jgi:hypothetical protein
VKTQLILPHFPHLHPRLRNALVSPVMWLYAALPASLAVWLEGASRTQLALAFLFCWLVYHLIYRWLAAKARLNPIPDSSAAPLMRQPSPLDPNTQSAKPLPGKH